MIINQMTKLIDNVPVIDISEIFQDKFDNCSREISKACMEWGFFQIINHQIDQNLIEKFQQEQRKFFKLSTETKSKLIRSQNNSRGWVIKEYTKQKIDWKEAFDFGAVPNKQLPYNDPQNYCQDGFNQWPENQDEFRNVMEEYFEQITNLSIKLNQAMAVGLNLPKDYFQQFFNKHSSFVRLNYYPICPQQDDHFGVSAHNDAGWLTVLLADEQVTSLQVEYQNEWITIKPQKNAFIINTGDMAQVWSNNIYKAPLHRVLANNSQERFSAPYFYNPNYDALVEPLNTCVDEQKPPQYRGFTWGQFRQKRFDGDYADLGEETQITHYKI